MNTTTPTPALTKTQREILELLKVEGEVITSLRAGGRYRLRKADRDIGTETFDALRVRGHLRNITDPLGGRGNVWRYLSPEEREADRAARAANDARREREAAERKADRNRRWAMAIEKELTAAYRVPTIVNPEWVAAVFDAIAAEAAGGGEVK